MVLQTTSLLRSIWEIPAWQNDLLTKFDRWVQGNASRSEAKASLKILVEAQLARQTTGPFLDIDLDQVQWDQITEFFCVCFSCRRRRDPLPDIPSDAIWKELTDEKHWAALSFHPQQDKAILYTVPVPFIPLEQKLLALGGKRMVDRSEPHLGTLLARGELLDGSVEFVSGKARDCHANSARLWRTNKAALAIATGYALSDDGMWRQHSWVLRKHPTAEQPRILETTLPRLKYFGCILDDTESETFS